MNGALDYSDAKAMTEKELDVIIKTIQGIRKEEEAALNKPPAVT